MKGIAHADVFWTTAQVSRATGATLRQLRWWDDHNQVQPRHVGHSRRYSLEHALLAFLFCKFRHRGFPVRRLLPKLRDVVVREAPALWNRGCTNDPVYLLTDGAMLLVSSDPQKIVSLALRCKTGIHLLDLNQAMLALCRSVGDIGAAA